MGTSSLRDAFSCRRESFCCRRRVCIDAQRLSFPLSSSCRALSCCFNAWRGQEGQELTTHHPLLSADWLPLTGHLDLLPLLLVGDGSGRRQVLLEHLALPLQLAALLLLVLLELGQLLGLCLLKLCTLFPARLSVKC